MGRILLTYVKKLRVLPRMNMFVLVDGNITNSLCHGFEPDAAEGFGGDAEVGGKELQGDVAEQVWLGAHHVPVTLLGGGKLETVDIFLEPCGVAIGNELPHSGDERKSPCERFQIGAEGGKYFPTCDQPEVDL